MIESDTFSSINVLLVICSLSDVDNSPEVREKFSCKVTASEISGGGELFFNTTH